MSNPILSILTEIQTDYQESRFEVILVDATSLKTKYNRNYYPGLKNLIGLSDLVILSASSDHDYLFWEHVAMTYGVDLPNSLINRLNDSYELFLSDLYMSILTPIVSEYIMENYRIGAYYARDAIWIVIPEEALHEYMRQTSRLRSIS